MKKGSVFQRVIINLLWVFLAAIFLFFISGIIVTKKYGGELKEYAIKQINDQIETKIKVGDIQLSFLSRFPYISVVFNDVLAWSSNDFNRADFANVNTDTLLFAEKIYLQLNIIDVIRSQYKIKRIYAHTGNLNILTDKKGKVNYNIFKEAPGSKDDQLKALELEGARLSGFLYHFSNKAKNTEVDGTIRNLLAKGRFAGQEFQIESSSEIFIHNFENSGISYVSNADLGIRLILNVKDEIASLEKGELRINNILLKAKGNIDFRETLDLNLLVETRSVDLNAVLKSLPEKHRDKIQMDLKGIADLAVKIDGPMSAFRTPNMKGVYLFNFDEIKYQGYSVKNLQIKGKYDNGKFSNPSSTIITIEKFRLMDRNSELDGSFEIKNLVSPEITMNMNGYLDAEVLNLFIDKNKSMDFTGIIEPDIKLKTKISSIKNLSYSNIFNGDIAGHMQVVNVALKYKNDRYENLNGGFEFSRDRWIIDLGFDFNNCPVELKAQADYFTSWIFNQNQSLWALVSLKTGDLKFRTNPGSETESDSNNPETYFLPRNLYLKGTAEIKSLEYGDLFASEIRTGFNYKPFILDINDCFMKGLDGSINGDISILQNTSGEFYFKTINEFENLDINKLFRSFKNFDQDFITYKNLKGTLSGNMVYGMTLDSFLIIDEKDVTADINLEIKNGELIDFEPAESLSRFIELKELEHIKFSELKNNILIREKIVSIPEMSINSSAFDIIVSGTHTFENYFDYKLKVNLSEILTGKAKNKLENQEQFVIEEEGRRAALYLSIYGTPDDFQVKYDKKKAVVSIKENMKEEKNTLKNILNEEFGWFKKDTGKINSPANTKSNPFIINWDEDLPDSIPDIKRKKRKIPKETKEDESFKIEWDGGDG